MRSSTLPSAESTSTGVAMPRARIASMTPRPSSCGSIRSVMTMSNWPLSACARPGATVGGVLHGMTALAQSLDEKARRFVVILDEQGVHGATA